MNYYDILGVSHDVTDINLKKQYRALSYKYHPDKNPSGESRMKDINEAYELLKDPNKRRIYDLTSGNSIETLLETIFKNTSKTKTNPIDELYKTEYKSFIHNEPIFIDALEVKIELSFNESYTGVQFPMSIKRTNTSGSSVSTEIEKIYLDIPRGIDDGEIIIIKEKGNSNNGIYGELKVRVKVIPSVLFERNGLDIIYRQTITFKESICGFEGNIKHVNNIHLKLQSSRGNIIQNFDEKLIKNKGFIRGTDNGNLIVIFKVVPPIKLTNDQLDILESILT